MNSQLKSAESGNRLLDLVSVSVAGMRDGVGPLLTVFLIQNTNWSPQHLSWALAAPSFMNILVQIPVGSLFDRVQYQGRLVALGGILMACIAFCISLVPSLEWMIVIQLMSGLACCLVSVGVPAMSLSTVSASHFGARLARNEIFSKVGNFGAIALTGYVAQNYSLHSMFFVIYVLALALVISSLALGRRANQPAVTVEAVSKESVFGVLNKIWQQSQFRTLVLVAFLYQFANASLFLVFEQSFVRQQKNGGAGILSASLFATQVVIILGSLALARWTKTFNPLKLLGVGFLLILIRALVFASQGGLVSLAVAQILDGCIAAILIIVPVRAIALYDDVHFNMMSGMLGTCVALGATLSTLVAGTIIGTWGFVAAFIHFGSVAMAGGLLTAVFLMLERKQTSRAQNLL